MNKKKSLKILVFILDFIKYLALNKQAFKIKTNIVLLILYLFQILLKFGKIS